MIKSITSGFGLTIKGGTISYPYINMTNYSAGIAGMLRFNGNTQNIEVYDGNTWYSLPNDLPSIELSSEVQSLLDWARKKRDEETRIKDLAKANPTIADLVTQRNKIDEQISIVKTLSE